MGNGGHLILQRGEFLDVGERQKVCARAERLADLDEGRPERDQVLLEPDGLLFEPRLLTGGAFLAAEDEAADEADQAVEQAAHEVAPALARVLLLAAPARLFELALGHLAVELRAHVVVVQEEVERHRAEHAHDLERAPPAGEAARVLVVERDRRRTLLRGEGPRRRGRRREHARVAVAAHVLRAVRASVAVRHDEGGRSLRARAAVRAVAVRALILGGAVRG